MFRVLFLFLAMGLPFSSDAQSQVRFHTNMGNFEVELTDVLTPRTVDSFLARVEEGFYDGLTFHRVIHQFMIQGGDPKGDGTGGPGYTLPDEIVPSLKNVRGALAMAHAGPNTAGSQFYINTVDNPHLDGSYTVFGKVTQGMSVVDQISQVPVVATKPVTPVVMDSLRIIHKLKVTSPMASSPLAVYPNPGSGLFHISGSKPASWRLFNTMGQVLVEGRTQGQNLVELDFRFLPSGIYMLEWKEKEARQVLRLQIR